MIKKSFYISLFLLSFIFTQDDLPGFSHIGLFEGKHYYLSNEAKTWMDARDIAIELEAKMVSIDNQDENDFIYSFMTGPVLWLGISDLETEGIWKNSSQEIIWIEDEDNSQGGGHSPNDLYTNWQPNEPNDIGGSGYTHCGTMGGGGQWDDYNCTYTYKFILERLSGCTDELACNYSDDVDFDDGSCEYYNCHNNGEYALYFNADELHFAELAHSSILNDYNSYTIEVLISKNKNNAPANTCIIESGPYVGPNFAAYYGSDDRVRFTHWTGDSNPIGNTSIANYEFHLISMTYDKTSNLGRIFIDGEYDGESLIEADFTGGHPFIIGGQSTSYLNGYISEVRIWNYALNEQELQENYNSDLTGAENGIIALYKLNKGEGNTLIDYSGNSNHGMKHGASWIELNDCLSPIDTMDPCGNCLNDTGTPADIMVDFCGCGGGGYNEEGIKLISPHGYVECYYHATGQSLNNTSGLSDCDLHISFDEIPGQDETLMRNRIADNINMHSLNFSAMAISDHELKIISKNGGPAGNLSEIIVSNWYEHTGLFSINNQWISNSYFSGGIYNNSYICAEDIDEYNFALDGIDDYLDVSSIKSNLSTGGDFTFDGYVKIDEHDGVVMSANTEDGENVFWIYVRPVLINNVSFGELSINTNPTGSYYHSSNYIISDGNWHRLFLSISGAGEYLISIDGDIIDQGQSASWVIDWDQAYYLSIGQEYDQGNQSDFLNATFDEIHLSNSVRAYGETYNIDQFSIAYYNFNQGPFVFNEEGRVLAFDISNHENHGIVNGDSNWSIWEGVDDGGCTDSYACNYDENANVNDGSCEYLSCGGAYGLSFDGDGDYVTVEDDPSIHIKNGTFTLEVDFLISNDLPSRFYTIINKSNNSGGHDYELRYEDPGALYFILGTGNDGWHINSGTPNLDDGQYHNCIITHSANSTKMYLDGVEVTSYGNSNYEFVNDGDIRIGTNQLYEHDYDGRIKRINIYDIYMTDVSDIELDTEFLQASYLFNRGEGATLHDHSGNRNHGDISGAVWEDEAPIPGCMDPFSCNYNPGATIDDGLCVYPEQNLDCDGDCIVDIDCGGVCGGELIDDCFGVCNGEAFIDECGVCSGGTSGYIPNDDMDCAGVCNGDAYLDNCDVCDVNPDNDCIQDCFGDWGGLGIVDNYENCCFQEFLDACGYCSGNDYDYCDGDQDGEPNIIDWGYGAYGYGDSGFSVVDIPNDQGGRVYISFYKSFYDTDTLRSNESYTIERFENNEWISLFSIAAYGQDQYYTIAETLQDSTSANSGLTEFRVIASMDEGNFASLDDENGWGYSVDNIHPSTPGEMMALSSDQDINISWSYAQDIDFDYHKVTDIDLAELYTIDNDISIMLEQDYNEYHVNTLDIHENESNDSEYAGAHNLHYGANLVSFSVIPEDNSLENMLSECDITDIIGEGKAASNTENGWIGNLDKLSIDEGYWVKANSGHICPTVGMNVIQSEYDLHIGANLISYACDEDGTLDDFNMCNGDVISIIGEGEAASCVNGDWIGNLDELSPGKGYWFKLNIGFTWDFECPEPLGESREYFAYESKEYAQSTQQAFYFFENIKGAQEGDVINVYSGDYLVGSSVWRGGYTTVPVMGDDFQLETDGYALVGQRPTFMLIKQTGQELRLNGNIPVFEINETFVIDGEIESVEIAPQSYALSKAYPNPFNPITTIGFTVPMKSYVTIGVYDINGRMIDRLASSDYAQGYHSVSWNASNVPSGMYFVKMSTDEFNATQKLMLIK